MQHNEGKKQCRKLAQLESEAFDVGYWSEKKDGKKRKENDDQWQNIHYEGIEYVSWKNDIEL